jgi:hypothetical protein
MLDALRKRGAIRLEVVVQIVGADGKKYHYHGSNSKRVVKTVANAQAFVACLKEFMEEE